MSQPFNDLRLPRIMSTRSPRVKELQRLSDIQNLRPVWFRTWMPLSTVKNSRCPRFRSFDSSVLSTLIALLPLFETDKPSLPAARGSIIDCITPLWIGLHSENYSFALSRIVWSKTTTVDWLSLLLATTIASHAWKIVIYIGCFGCSGSNYSRLRLTTITQATFQFRYKSSFVSASPTNIENCRRMGYLGICS